VATQADANVVAHGLEVSAPSPRRRQLRVLARRALHSKTFMVGAVIVLFWILDALCWQLVVPHDPQATNPLNGFKPPSTTHWFGTDDFGRDVFSRVMAGASSVLTVAPAGTALGLLGGTLIGLTAGYYRGVFDEVVMRIIDMMVSVPLIIYALLVLSALGSSKLNVVLIIGILFTPLVCRTVRSATLAEREKEYVDTAKLRGETNGAIILREILPNITGPVTVEATIRLGYAIFVSATLSFLSLGVQQPSPDWGLSIALARPFVDFAPWMVLFPAGALATLIIGVNLVADGLREMLET
jgi:peptide/nickel transport system permease protein